jgi:hypothetical protein
MNINLVISLFLIERSQSTMLDPLVIKAFFNSQD